MVFNNYLASFKIARLLTRPHIHIPITKGIPIIKNADITKVAKEAGV